MGQRAKAKSYFQLLSETTSNDDYLDVATIYSYLGRIAREDCDYNAALSHHRAALEVRSFTYSYLLALNSKRYKNSSVTDAIYIITYSKQY